MKKIFIFAILFFYPFSLSASPRQTNFEERPVCENNHGVWREFGDACVNNCSDKYDPYRVCAKAITYSCDCGQGRCWHENKCIANSSYKIIAQKEQEETQKELALKRKEREERINNDPALRAYLYNLYPIKTQQQEQQNGQNAQQQPANNQQQQIIISQPTPPQIQPQNNNETAVPQQRTPPPFYLDQQQKLQAQQNLTNSNAAKMQAPSNQESTKQQPPLEFPQIPMPQ